MRRRRGITSTCRPARTWSKSASSCWPNRATLGGELAKAALFGYKKARQRFLSFALDPNNPWSGNFRDLNAMVVRMATLADGGRINLADVNDEISRCAILEAPSDRHQAPSTRHQALLTALLGEDYAERYDDFDLVQLAHVIEVCRVSDSAAAAARKLYAVSFKTKTSSNSTDRLSKYLARFGLRFREIRK